MSILQAYLRNPRTRRALTLKPGEKGFSLIELVVVVAVLAILSAIAVPAYLGMQEQAADAAAGTNLKNAYKECAYQSARGIAADGQAISATNPATFDFPQDDQFFAYTQNGIVGNCTRVVNNATTANVVTATKGQGSGQGTLTINLLDGTRGTGGGAQW